MSIEGQIIANSGSQAPDVASEIQASVDAALEKDPQRQLAKRVAEDLKAAGVDNPEAATTEAPENKETNSEFLEAKQRISKALQERNKTFKERESARQEADTIRQEALRMRAEAEAFSRQIQQQQAQMQQWAMNLRSNPVEALRMANIDPEDFILGIAKEGTEEGKLHKQLREQQAKLTEFENWKKSQAEQVEQQKREYMEKQAQQFRGQVENDFFKLAGSEKYSNVNKALDAGLISRNALLVEGDSIADKYREATGQEASLEDILEYIDSQVANAINKISGAQKVGATTNQAKPAQVQPVPKVGQTLSQDEASERRALGKDLVGADADERRLAAREAVKAVLSRANKSD